MKYSYRMTAPANAIFEILMLEQCKYYQHFLPKMKVLTVGTTVETKLPTKLNKVPVSATLKVLKIDSPKQFVQETISETGKITQAYQIEQKDDRLYLTYEEKNDFKQSLAKASYGVTGLFYHFIFNQRAKKRARYLNTKAQALTAN